MHSEPVLLCANSGSEAKSRWTLARRPEQAPRWTSPLGAAPGLAVRGNVDVAAVPPLEEALEAAIKTTIGAFVIDLSDVEILDSSGLLAVLHARGPLARDQRALAVVCPPGRVRQLFEVAGAAEQFFLYDSREDVDAALVPAR